MRQLRSETKEAVTKVIDTLTQQDFHGAFQKLLERYNKCIAAGGDYFEGDKSFICVLSIKVSIRKKSGKLSYAPRICANVIFLATLKNVSHLSPFNLEEISKNTYAKHNIITDRE